MAIPIDKGGNLDAYNDLPETYSNPSFKIATLTNST